MTTTLKPCSDRPEAIPIILDSAIPTSKNLSGYFAANLSVRVGFERSALRTRMLSLFSAQFISSLPNVSRVANNSIPLMLFDILPH